MAQDPISDLQKEIGRIAEERHREAQEAHAEAIRDFHKDLYSHQFKEAHGYTQMVVFGGYAAYFAGWGFLRNILHEHVIVASAFFMLVSISVFVFSEIYWMWRRGEDFHGYAERLSNEPLRFVELQEEFDGNHQERMIKDRSQNIKVLLWTIVPGAVAVGLFVLGFINYLYDLWKLA